MKFSIPRRGNWLTCGLLALCAVPAAHGQLRGGAAPAKRRAALYCTNEPGELRCSRRETTVVENNLAKPAEGATAEPSPRVAVAELPVGPSIPSRPAAGAINSPGALPPSGEIFVEVRINGRTVDDFARLLHFGAGQFYVTAAQFIAWRLKPPTSPAVKHEGGDYYPLDVNGISYRIDPQQQALLLTAPATAFAERIVDLTARSTDRPDTPQPGLFLNHDFQFTHSSGNSNVTGLAEVGFFSKFGVLTTRLVTRDLTRSLWPSRLDTQLVRDFPRRMATLTIGDAISAATPWARQVHYAGVRWASKFSTQPAFVPFVLPSLQGQAAQPSAIDIYVDNIKTNNQTVDAGPFSIRNIPVMSGQGELRMVVTDILGRQHVVTQAYLTSRELLRQGVNEYTYEGGLMRQGFGSTNGSYRTLFFAGTQRRGITDSLTLNWRGEMLGRHQTAGVGADYALLPFGLMGGGVAVSRAAGGLGVLAYGHFEHRTRAFGYSASVQATTGEFTQVGLLSSERPSRLVGQFQVSRSLGNKGSLALGLIRHERRMGTSRDASAPTPLKYSSVTASASFRIAGGLFLAVSTNYSPGLRGGISAAVNLVVPLGNRQMLTTSSEMQSGRHASTIDFTQQLPIGSGYGYRVRTGLSDNRTDAALWLQENRGTYAIEAGRHQGDTAWRFSERGSLLWIGRHVARSRWLDDSFGVVEVPAGKGIRVFANNQVIASTSGRGVAIIPRLVPYERNSVYLDDSGVPIEMGMDFSEKTVVPMPRSGVLVKFQAAKIEGAVLVLVAEEGAPVPLGAEVTINDDTDVHRVALRGEVFVSKVSFPARVRVRWPNGQCEAFISDSPGSQPMPRIGPTLCKAL